MDAKTKMTRARVQLLLSEPFFGSLLLNLKSEQNDAIPTMGTDGHRLLWSSKFVDSLGEAETRTILAHEVMHCALLHHLRRQQRDAQAWNMACIAGHIPIALSNGNIKSAASINPSDRLYTPFGEAVVSRVVCKRSTAMVRVRLADSRTLVCTADHPIITKEGCCREASECEGSQCWEILDAKRQEVPPKELVEAFRNADSYHLRAHLQDLFRASAKAGNCSEPWCEAGIELPNPELKNLAMQLSSWNHGWRGDYLGSFCKDKRQDLLSTRNFNYNDLCPSCSSSGRCRVLLGKTAQYSWSRIHQRNVEQLGRVPAFCKASFPLFDYQTSASSVAFGALPHSISSRILRKPDWLTRIPANVCDSKSIKRQTVLCIEELSGTADVYDFITDLGCYVANGILVHNCDHAVNLILEECNAEARGKGRSEPFPWPKEFPACKDPQFKGKSAEEIYNLMPKSPQGGQAQGKCSTGQQPGNGPGEVWDDPGVKDEATQSQEETNWKKAIIDAAKAAKQIGTMPAEMRKLVEDILNPKASWREILRRFVSDHAKDDYSWTRPNPRYASTGFILPSLYSQRLGAIGIIRDTSGSTQDWQAEILTELAGIIHECQPSKVIVIDADAAVARVLELEPSDPLPTDAMGGGGTDFRPALAKLEEYDIRCAVYITDLAGTHGEAPTFPVLWATNERNAKVPFGEIIEV